MSASVILLSFQFWVDTAAHNVRCIIRSSSLESGGVKTWLKFEAICWVGKGKTSCRARKVWQGWLLLLPFLFFLSPRLPPSSSPPPPTYNPSTLTPACVLVPTFSFSFIPSTVSLTFCSKRRSAQEVFKEIGLCYWQCCVNSCDYLRGGILIFLSKFKQTAGVAKKYCSIESINHSICVSQLLLSVFY